MLNIELRAETKIFEAAKNIFLLYGYHGAILQQIAAEADVNTAAIHYYFRSKERLYHKVVINVLELVLNIDNQIVLNMEQLKKHWWFLFTELYNNKERFEKTLQESYPDEWDKKINELKMWLEISAKERPLHLDNLG